jgi:hypothetical protein
MSDGSSKVPWIVSIAVAVIGFIASPVWGPPLCRAIGVCEAEAPMPPGGNGPTITVPPFSFPPNLETNIFLSETSGPAGSTLKVSGEGFQPGETIVITMATTQVGTTTASPAGKFSSVEITVPEKFGVFEGTQFRVTARGKASIKFASAPFTVSG